MAENYLGGRKPGFMTSYQGTAEVIFLQNPEQTQGPGSFSEQEQQLVYRSLGRTKKSADEFKVFALQLPQLAV